MSQALVLAGQTITPAVLNRTYGTGDSTQHTVNVATFATLSTVYTIPALDALTGTAYRVSCFGNGTWGSTQQNLSFGMFLAGTQIGASVTANSTVFPTSAAFDWEAEFTIWCVTAGSSGTWIGRIRGTLTETANNIVVGTAADNSVPFAAGVHTAVTQDTTIDNTFAIQAKWASTTGTPTMTCLSTLFEKVN